MTITVMATGTFDVVHPGHIYFLNEAKKLGDRLIVVIARDATVKKIKGFTPRHSEKQRLLDISLIPCVDEVHLGSEGDKYAIVEKLKPNIIALGYDQSAFIDKLDDELKKRRIDAKIVRVKSHKPQRFKSSKLKEILPKDD